MRISGSCPRWNCRCIMCGVRMARRRIDAKLCGPVCRKRFSRWQAKRGPGPEAYGGLQAEKD